VLIGHNTNPDEVGQAAKAIADARGLGVAAHMSPYAADPQWFLEHCGRRPVEHLAEIGVLGSNLALTHMVHIDEHEQRLLAEAGASVVHCPFAALKGAFGVGRRGRFPEMAQAGINIALGTDGYASDLLAKTGLCAALFKDAREDRALFPAREVLAMATANGARVLGMAGAIGVLRPGARADIVMHELDRPEWRPVLDPLEQLVFSADGRSVHSVWVDGERVVEGYHCTRVDEQALYAAAQCGFADAALTSAMERAIPDFRTVYEEATGRFGAQTRGIGGIGNTGAGAYVFQLMGRGHEAAGKHPMDAGRCLFCQPGRVQPGGCVVAGLARSIGGGPLEPVRSGRLLAGSAAGARSRFNLYHSLMRANAGSASPLSTAARAETEHRPTGVGTQDRRCGALDYGLRLHART